MSSYLVDTSNILTLKYPEKWERERGKGKREKKRKEGGRERKVSY